MNPSIPGYPENQEKSAFRFHPRSLILNLTYLQRYFLLCFFFSLSLVPLILFSLSFYEEKISFIERELFGNQYLMPVRTLLEQIPQHQILTYRYHSGNPDLKNTILNMDVQINASFKKLAEKENESKPFFEYVVSSQAKPSSNVEDLRKKWGMLSKQILDINTKTSDPMYRQIIEDIETHISHIEDNYLLITDFDLASYYVIDTSLVKIPAIQIQLGNILRKSLEIFSDKKVSSVQRDELIYQLQFVRDNFKSIEVDLEKTFSFGSHLLDLHLVQNETLMALGEYLRSTEAFLTMVSTKLLEQGGNSLTLADILSLGNAAISSGFGFWDGIFEITDVLLKYRKQALTNKFWASFGLSIFLALIAYLLGTFIVYNTKKRMLEVTDATNSFANGNLSIRVPATYRDEVGVLGRAFNVMAQKTEELFNQLYRLLDSTKALAGGDLSVRIYSEQPDSEFGKVAAAFNNMAESFENIIHKLQQIGINLTTSATEIAAAAKQQETITIEQEATTREISIAASEISSTAKEFANTMNDVSVVAEQTSTLAVSGKDALNNMESVMRQMVDASGNIATKLAVLNEKASNITSVITTITKVADQTNLLSLNASIEAEKAGEYGRSFAVIAREIRRLADQTAIATLDIEKMVNEIMTAVSSSVMGVDDFTQEIRVGVNQVKKVSEQLAEIIEQVQALTLRFETVNQGMQAQSTGAEQINEAIAQLSQTAQQTTESIQQFHKTIQELNIAAQELRGVAPRIHKTIRAFEGSSMPTV